MCISYDVLMYTKLCTFISHTSYVKGLDETNIEHSFVVETENESLFLIQRRDALYKVRSISTSQVRSKQSNAKLLKHFFQVRI
jgi:hypothetical protein